MARPLNKGVGGSIPADQAKAWIKNYTDKNPGGIKAHFFGSDIIEQILAQEGCVGIRIYHAIDDNGITQAILVGALADGNNIWPSNKGDSYPNGIVGDKNWLCPPDCADNE